MEENNQQQNNTPAPQNAPAGGEGGGQTGGGNPPDNRKVMSILSYIGPLVIVSYITSKDDPVVKFHIKQGLVLFVLEIAMWVIGMMIWMFWPILQIVNLALLVLSVIGIMNAVNGRQKELPFVGSYAKYFNNI